MDDSALAMKGFPRRSWEQRWFQTISTGLGATEMSDPTILLPLELTCLCQVLREILWSSFMSVIDGSCMGESSLSCPNVSSLKASSADEKGGCRFEVLESSFLPWQ